MVETRGRANRIPYPLPYPSYRLPGCVPKVPPKLLEPPGRMSATEGPTRKDWLWFAVGPPGGRIVLSVSYKYHLDIIKLLDNNTLSFYDCSRRNDQHTMSL